MYADDVQIITSSSKTNPPQCIHNILILNKVSQRALENKLELNPSKSEAILISNSRIKTENLNKITLNGDTVPLKSIVNDLGFLIDSKLSFNDHATKISAQIYSTLRQLWINAKYMSTEIRRRLVVSLIIPKIIYGAPILICASKGAWHHLNIAFNSCARFIYRKKDRDRISSFTKQIGGSININYKSIHIAQDNDKNRLRFGD
jgi:hypothetical protein